jgi:hypothetical protein
MQKLWHMSIFWDGEEEGEIGEGRVDRVVIY